MPTLAVFQLNRGLNKFETGSMILKFMSIQTSVGIHVAVCLRDMGIKGFIVDLNWLPVMLSVDRHGNLSYVYLMKPLIPIALRHTATWIPTLVCMLMNLRIIDPVNFPKPHKMLFTKNTSFLVHIHCMYKLLHSPLSHITSLKFGKNTNNPKLV
jgi:hypothetical protein